MTDVSLLYELPSGHIVTIVCDLGTLDSTCDKELEPEQEIWAINYWEVDNDGEELEEMDQRDIDTLDEIELLDMCVEEINRAAM